MTTQTTTQTSLQSLLIEMSYEATEIKAIEGAMFDDHKTSNWRVLQVSIFGGCDLWIYADEAELTFFDLYTGRYVDLRNCSPKFIVEVANELGEEVINDLYSDELEQAKEALVEQAKEGFYQ